MGVPALFRWLSQKYPKIISPVIEELPRTVGDEVVPVDISAPNPNGDEMDNLYLDMNGIVHPCSHPEDRPPPSTEEEMMLEVFKYTERVVNMVRPRKLLMIAVDGVAPRAKMNQQRSRRFRSAQEAKEKDEDKAEMIKMLKSKSGGVIDEEVETSMNKKTWDSNAITPGTPFMDILAASLRYWVAYKLNTDSAWAKLKVIISDATVPGEGEHKIMEFIRSQRSSPEHDPNTRHVIYGLDADLIMLGIATHEPHFRVLREDVFFQESKARTCRICGQKGHMAEQCRGEAKPKDGEFDEKDKAHPLKPFIWLHVSILREYLEAELYVPAQPFPFDLERALDDWVFMCFFVGNDFLPHLPSLDIREDGIDTLIAIWRDNIPIMGGYVTKDGHVDLARAQIILNGLAKQESAIFRRRRQTEERRDANAKRRKLNEQDRSNSQRSMRNFSGNGGGPASSPADNTPTRGGRRSGRQPPPSGPPEGLPLFKPGELTEEIRAITHDMVVNRTAMYQASQSNKSAAAVLKSRMLGQGAATDNAGPQENGDSEPSADKEEAAADKAESANGASPAVEGQASASTSTPAPGKRKADLISEEGVVSTPDTDVSVVADTPNAAGDDERAPDTVRLWEDGYSERYYEQKFGVDPQDLAFRQKVGHAYAEGLAWVLLYYFQGCPSWTWYYPYHYAPFAADFTNLETLKIGFEKGVPFKPFEQLMGVLPAASKHAIPEVFQSLMTEDDSEIIDFYPEDFPIDLNGKKFAWQGVALLPFIDEKRLLKAMSGKYSLLSAEDAARNEVGKDVLLVSDAHPLYDEVATNFYSKRQGSPKYKLNPRVTDGLAGKVEKIDDQLPRGSLSFPLKDGGMPDLDDDRSISVHYDMPRIGHIHKSMLLRGVKFPPPTLDRSDIDSTKNRAGRSGRNHGGAPLRGDHGNGRGRGRGRIDYAPNMPPSSFPTPPPGVREGPTIYPASHPGQEWARQSGFAPGWPSPFPPPPHGFPAGAPIPSPPVPPQGGFSYGYGPPGGGYPPPPPYPPQRYDSYGGSRHRPEYDRDSDRPNPPRRDGPPSYDRRGPYPPREGRRY
ncbi:MAG: Histone H4 [Watsoniomyces obsoletus]|nr:MAG: Histone H4 [Watsoniomyces obsoletus]